MASQNGKTEIDKIKKTGVESILDDLATELDQGRLEDTFVVRKIHWKMMLLQDHENNWANSYQRTNSALAILSSRRAPVLAIGIREIGREGPDGKVEMKTVKAFFLDEWKKERGEMDEISQRILDNSNEIVQQYWFAEKLYEWLSKRPSEFIQELWSNWLKLEERRTEAEKAMGKSSQEDGSSKDPKTTLSSVSSETSQSLTGSGNS
jgi:hypothetical protein